jgi:hypothetical protein
LGDEEIPLLILICGVVVAIFLVRALVGDLGVVVEFARVIWD